MKVYGLDINPRAVKVSRINLYLNALDEKGQPIYDEEKKTLLDRVEFYESDLLSYIRDHGIQLDRIVGCIPQVFPGPSRVGNYIGSYMGIVVIYVISASFFHMPFHG